MTIRTQALPLSRCSLKNKHEVVIREGRPEDAEDVLALTKAVIDENDFVVTSADEFALTVDQEAEWISYHLEDPNHLIIVAEVDSQVIGMLHFISGDRKRLAHRGNFHMLIDKNWRSVGVGTALIRTLLDWATNHPVVEKVCFAVFSNNTQALALYRKFGFKEEGRRVKEIKLGAGQYVDDILMYRFVKGE